MQEYLIIETNSNTLHKVFANSLKEAFRKASKKQGIYPSEKEFKQL